EEIATDDAIDLLDLLIRQLVTKSKRRGRKERLRSLKDLDQAALQLAQATAIILNENIIDEQVRQEVFSQFDPQQLADAIETINQLASGDDQEYYQQLMLSRWRHIRRFFPKLLETITFQATVSGQAILDALNFLKSLEGSKKMNLDDVPLGVITSKSWWGLISNDNETFNRRAYTFCVLEQLRIRLRRRDVFVSPSRRWNDPTIQLLQGDAWKSAKPHVCRLLDRNFDFQAELKDISQQLHQTYLKTSANFNQNGAVRLEIVDGKEKLVLTGLEKLDEPSSLVALRSMVKDLLPRVDLPEILLEIHQKTGFASAFTHLSEQNARVQDLDISICAVLLSEACNIDLEPLSKPDLPALTADRLSWVKQNYLRQETIIEANACLVDAQAKIELAQIWGGGEVASADGLRFRVPVSTLNATPNSKYFGTGKGITYYNFTSDQFTGFHSIVIPGTLRDSLYVLEGLLEQQTSLRPTEIMTDTAGYSDVVFGLFWLLGYQFSLRLADIGDARFWRIDQGADYGILNNLARNPINITLIEDNWDDLLRVAGSLKLGTVSASDLMGTLQGGKNQSTLSRAIAEVGRIGKTLYLLNYIDDEAYRRRILIQLNRGEGRHKLARVVFHGKRGEIYRKYREGQEDQLSALGLVVNAIVLWNTYYLQEAICFLKGTGIEVKDEDLARLSPLLHRHINMLGRYHFELPPELLQGQMRSLRFEKFRML
ncbi:MAG: Tn3 family transposase, partial [Alphaproteobacteria bacterium]